MTENKYLSFLLTDPGHLSGELCCNPQNPLYTDTSKGSYHISAKRMKDIYIYK